MKPVNRIKEEQRAHAFVKVIAGATEGLERRALIEQLL